MLAAASGLALALAHPRTDWSGTAWVALAPVLVLALLRPPRAALGWGWLAGSVFFVLLLRWLNFTFQTYSAIPWPLVWLPTLALAGYCGLYTGLVAALLSWIGRRAGPGRALLLAPFAWVAAEWVRGGLLGGFPWGSLGYSQYRQLAVIQVAELGGVHAVSFVVLAANAGLAGLALLPRRRAAAGLLLAAAVVGAAVGFGAWRLGRPGPPAEATVTVMQPAIEQPLKWDPQHVPATLRIYDDLTARAAAGRPDLIVWPETAAPTVLRRDPALLARLQELSAAAGGRLLVGSIDVEGGRRLSNAAFLVGPAGIVERYDKIHLVPFGEYVPLASVIGFVRSWAEFIAELTPGSRAVVFPGPPVPFGVVICYEGVFPGLVRRFVQGGARFIVNMTNDAWFGRTEGPLQHLAMYPLRAVEHRTAVVRAANTGVSALVAPTGEIVAALGLYERGNLTGRIPYRQGTTLFTRFGEWLAYLSLAVTGLAAARGAAGGGRGRPGTGSRRDGCSGS